MRNQKGVSLIELTVAIGLAGLVGLMVMNVSKNAGVNTRIARTKTDIHSDTVLQENILSNIANSLDMRVTFTGSGLPLTTTPFNSRFVIPLPQQCRDLGTTGCESDTSLMFVNYRKKTNPAVDLVCSFVPPYPGFSAPPPYPSPNNYRILVFDGNRTTYGTTTVSTSPSRIHTTGIFEVNHPGYVSLGVSDIISIQNGPASSLWRVVKGLQKFNPPFNSIKTFILMNCGISTTMADKVYYAFVEPLRPLHDTTRHQSDISAEVQRVNNVEIMTMGRKHGDKTFGVNKCRWNQPTSKLVCPDDYGLPKLQKIDWVRVDQEFRLAIHPSTTTKWYDVGRPCGATNPCTLDPQPLLNVPINPPGLSRITFPPLREVSGVPFLLENTFSFYKQHYLHRVRFRMKQENKRREVFIRFF